ncbi:MULTISPECIES: hypothetical protein [Paenibacillus]|uniref:Uncharacterized membrane protein (DUF485 family) n=1 Tax=Paenibacillus silagei TaxID=1670801 RepID=A0ABS4NQ22_9BACL|nr:MULTISPECIES: hypothetical protein [Paenibacillus]ETT79662.1 hypothetical protein C173_00847 [Paenibacillus sp. FSL R7-277]MBP2112169.1 uncharacterized membrane protein (DUF485 family) [Paenibacillus silagei]
MDYHTPPKSDTAATEPARWGSSEQDMNPDYVYQENKRDYKHSGPGIASFVIALLTLVCYAITFVYVGAQASSLMNEHNKLIADSAETIMYLGLTMLILVAVNIIGAVTGIIGLTLRRRRKVFAIIGTIINAGFLLLFMLLLSVVLVNAGAS